MRATFKAVKELADRLGIEIEAWSPGDGMTRYRLTFPEQPFSDVMAMGSREALVVLRAVEWKRERVRFIERQNTRGF
jgi:hypothetical protein